VRKSAILQRAWSEASFFIRSEWPSKESSRWGSGSTRREADSSASMTHRSTHLDKDAKFEPSRSRMLNAIKARTNGMLAIHATCRQLYLTLRSFIGVVSSALRRSLRRDFIYYRVGKPVKRSIPRCSGYVKFLTWARILTWNFLATTLPEPYAAMCSNG